MNQCYNEINRFIDAYKDEMVKKWETLVNMEGHYNEKGSVERVAGWLKNEFEQEGFQYRAHEAMKEKAGILVRILGSDRPRKPVISSGHIDTIHHSGSFGKENLFKIRDGKTYGPDVLDMKGGIIISPYMVKALSHLGYSEHPIKILCTGEEESDHIGNDTDIFYMEESKGALYAFNIEAGHIGSCLCVGRKTQYTVHAKAHGLSRHTGDEFTKGKNTIHEAIFKAAGLIKLTDLDRGMTVTVSVINSGTNTNTTSIPDLSEFAVDIRVFSDEIGKKVLENVDQIMRKVFVEGTTMEYYVDLTKLHPFEPNPQIMRLFSLVNQIAADHGLAEFGQIRLGDVSNVDAIAAARVLVPCSCGPIGEFNYNVREYAVVDSLFEHAKMYALTIAEIGKL